MTSTNMFRGNTTCTLANAKLVSRPVRSSRLACNASKQPNEAVLKIAGAAAAAQIALLPFAGGAMANQFDLAFGEDLQAQARASDARTSAEPSLGDVGKSLQNQLGGNSSAPDVGKAIKDNTPSAGDLAQKAKEAGKKLNNAASDLGDVNLLEKAKDAAGSASGSAKDAAGSVQGSIKSATGDVAGNVKSASGEAQGAVKGAVRQVTPDISGVFDDLAGKAKDAAGSATGTAKDAAGSVQGSAKSLSGDVAGNVKSAAGEAQGAAKGAGRQLQQSTPDLSGVFDDLVGKTKDATGSATGAAKDAAGSIQGSAKSASGDVVGTAKSVAGEAQGAAKGAARRVDQATPDLSGVFDGLLDQGKSAAKDVQDAAGKKADNLKNDVVGKDDINAAAKRVVGQSDNISKTLDENFKK